jgi:hypothetical protein
MSHTNEDGFTSPPVGVSPTEQKVERENLHFGLFAAFLSFVVHFFIFHSLGAFAKLQKATISFVITVRLSVHMEQLGSHWMYFHEI